MLAALTLVSLLQLTAQDPAGEPPPPPLVPLAPSSPAPEPVTPAPDHSPPPAAPTGPKSPRPDPREQPSGISQPALAFIQIAAGTGACVGGCCVAIVPALGIGLVPVVGGIVAGVLSDLIVGGAVGVTETWVGDGFGTDRAALIWPVVTSVGTLALSRGFLLVARAVDGTPPLPAPAQDPTPVLREFYATRPLSLTAELVSVGACAGAIVLPAVVYALTSVPKKPGDHGQGFPGIMEPYDPTGTSVQASASNDAERDRGGGERRLAMRY